MKDILFVGDLHFDAKNIDDCKLFAKKLIAYVKENEQRIRAVILLGDMLNNFVNVHMVPYTVVVDLIFELNKLCTVMVIIGNHDMVSSAAYLDGRHAFKAFGNDHNTLEIVEKPTLMVDGLLCVPYVPPGRFHEAISEFDLSKINLIACHQEFKGCDFGGFIGVDGDEWPLDAPLVVSGHIHKNQWLQKNIYYPGTPFAHTFGEIEDKSISFWNGKTMELIDLGMPKKITLRVELDKIESLDVDWSINHYRLEVYGEYAELAAFAKTKKHAELKECGVKIILTKTDEFTEKKMAQTTYTEEMTRLIEKEKNAPLLLSLLKEINED